VLFSKYGVILGCVQTKVVEQLQPKTFKLISIGLKQIEVIADCRKNIIKFSRFIFVFSFDLSQDWSLNAFIGLHVFHILV
jgi:hypothetical protein